MKDKRTPKDLGAVIASRIPCNSGRDCDVRIELPDGTEYTLCFPASATDESILSEKLQYWHVI